MSIPSPSPTGPFASHDSPSARRSCTSFNWPLPTYAGSALRLCCNHALGAAAVHPILLCPFIRFFYPISLLVVPPPAPPSRPGTALGQAAATVARTRRRLQGSHATASSPHDTSPACQVLTSCSALSGRHQEFLFHHAASTGHRDHSLRKRLRFFENKSQKHDEAGRPQNVVMRPALGIWHSRLVVVAHVEARDCCDEVNRVGLRLKKHPHVSRHQKEIDARVTRYAMSPARAPSQSRSNGFFPVLMPGNGTRKFSHGWLWRDRGKGKACLAGTSPSKTTNVQPKQTSQSLLVLSDACRLSVGASEPWLRRARDQHVRHVPVTPGSKRSRVPRARAHCSD